MFCRDELLVRFFSKMVRYRTSNFAKKCGNGAAKMANGAVKIQRFNSMYSAVFSLCDMI